MNIVIALILLLMYIVGVSRVKGKLPSSLSASVFSLSKGEKWLWTAVIYTITILCLVPAPTSLLNVVKDGYQWCIFLALAALLFVGAAPLVTDKGSLAYKVHCGAAVICAVCSQIAVGVTKPELLWLWALFAVGLIYNLLRGGVWRTRTFWGEMVCFINTLILGML